MESTKDTQNEPIADPPLTDYLYKECQKLFFNVSKFDKVFKKQDLIRHAYSSLMETTHINGILSNYSQPSESYQNLLKSDIFPNFIEYHTAVEKLKVKFFTEIMEIETLKKNLNDVNDEMSSFKLQYEEIQCREESSKNTLEYINAAKLFRVKSIEIMFNLERLNTFLCKACEENNGQISEYENLKQTHTELFLTNPIVKEFLDYAKYQEKMQSESTEETKNLDCSTSSLDQANSDELRQTEYYQEKLMEEQRRRVEMEKEKNALVEFSDKLCLLLHKYQNAMLLDKTSQESTSSSEQNSPEKSNSTSSDSNAVEELSSAQISKSSASKVNEGNSATGNFAEKRDPIVAAVLSNLSNQEPVAKPKPVENFRRVRLITEFYCKFCDKYYANEEHLRYHRRTVHGSNLKCAVCGKRFATKWSMLRHMLAKHTYLRPFKCNFCDYNSADQSSVMKHQRMFHNQEKNRFVCAHCERRFLQKQMLVHHICSKHFSEK